MSWAGGRGRRPAGRAGLFVDARRGEGDPTPLTSEAPADSTTTAARATEEICFGAAGGAAEYWLRLLGRAPVTLASGAPGRAALHCAMELVDDPDTVVVGSAPWQMRAAVAAELRPFGVLSGGSDERSLRRAGAVAVEADLVAVVRRLDRERRGLAPSTSILATSTPGMTEVI